MQPTQRIREIRLGRPGSQGNRVTHWCADPVRRSEREICSDMQITAQWWEQLLYSSGGKLELSKCFFYLMHWDFCEEGVPSLRKPEDFVHTISITDSEDGSRFPIPQRACHVAHKTLGVMETPDGSNNAKFDRLSLLSNTHGQKVATGRLSRKEASIYFNTIYLPSMSYGLVVGTMSMSQCESIQGKTRMSMLSAMGYKSTSPRQVAFASVEVGGYGLQHLFDRQ
jgi:hypothetical protein